MERNVAIVLFPSGSSVDIWRMGYERFWEGKRETRGIIELSVN